MLMRQVFLSTQVLREKSFQNMVLMMLNKFRPYQITVLACGNVSGFLLLTMIVFPGERFNYNPLYGAVPNSFLGRTKNGWMNIEVFFM